MLGFNILNYIGIAVFALSGALKGVQKELDFFGVFVAALLTAIGGGSIRDILLGEAPQFVYDVWYFVAVGAAVILMGLFNNHFRSYFAKSKFVVYMDALGLGTFAVLGAAKGLHLNAPIQAVFMVGLLTGIGGGMIRDILLREVPLVLKGELYATAALLGIGLLIFLIKVANVPFELSMYISAGFIAILRALAYIFQIKIKPL